MDDHSTGRDAIPLHLKRNMRARSGKKELPGIPGKVRASAGPRMHLETAGAGLQTRWQHGYDAHPRH